MQISVNSGWQISSQRIRCYFISQRNCWENKNLMLLKDRNLSNSPLLADPSKCYFYSVATL